MQDETPHTGRRRRLRRWTVGIAVALALVATLLAALPLALQVGLTRWLAGQGIEQAGVEDVDFNPFTGTLAVRGLEAIADGGRALRLPRAAFRFQWGPLWHGELRLETVRVDGLRLLITRDPEGALAVGGILLGGGGTNGGSAPSWALTVDRWQVRDAVVTYRSGGVDTVLQVDEWSVHHLSSERPDEPAAVTFRGALNHTPLDLQADVTPFATEPDWQGRVVVQALELAPFTPLLGGHVAPLAGTVVVDGKAELAATGGGGLRASYQGHVGLDGARAAAEPTLRLEGDGIGWDGRLDLVIGSGGVRLDLDGELQGKRMAVMLPETPGTVEQAGFTWDGSLGLDTGGEAQPLTLTVGGKFQGGPLAVDLPAAGVTVHNRAPQWDGTVELTQGPEGATNLAVRGKLADETVAVALPDAPVSVKQTGLTWDGSLGLEAGSEAQPLALTVGGKLKGGPLTVDLPATGVTVRNQAPQWDGTVELSQGPEGATNLAVRGKLADETVAVELPEAGISIRHRTTDWAGSVRLDQPAAGPLALKVEGRLRGAHTEVGLPDIEVGSDAPDWSGLFTLRLPETGPLELTAEGDLEAAAATVALAGSGIRVEPRRPGWKGRLEVTAPEAGPARVTVTGTLRGEALRAAGAAFDATAGGLDWSGRLVAAGAGAPLLDAEGDLRARQLDLRLETAGVHLEQRDPQWTGRLRLSEAGTPHIAGQAGSGPWQATVADGEMRLGGADLQWDGNGGTPAGDVILQGTVRARALEAARTAPPEPLFGADQVTAQGLRIGAAASIDTVTIERPTLLPQTAGPDGAARPAALTADAAHLLQLSVSDANGLALERLEVTGAVGHLVHRAENGGEPGSAGVAAQPAGDTGPSAAAAPALPLRIGEVRLTGHSRLVFEDRTLEPPFQREVVITEARLSDLDSRRPASGSPFTVAATIGEYTRLRAEGTVAPFNEPIGLDMTGRAEGLDLPPLSPYAVREMGYRVAAGHLDAESRLKIEDGRLDGHNALTFRNLQVEPAANSQTQELLARLKMPLGQALNLLRDKQNNIRLDLPVSGDLAAPEFDFGDAINQALATTVRFAAVGYLKHALQPYGTLITIVELADKAADMVGAIRLDPILFEPGAANLDATARDYVDHIAKVMRERPQLQVRLCGRAAAADRAVLTSRGKQDDKATTDETLLELARSRAAQVKGRLVGEHGVAAERLFICHPELDDKAGAAPRVLPMI